MTTTENRPIDTAHPDWAARPTPDSPEAWVRRAHEVAEILAVDAAERDRAAATPYREIQLLRDAGLVTLLGPVEHGGAGLEWPTAYLVTRAVAEGDGSIGQLLGYHYLWNWAARLVGTREQIAHVEAEAARHRWFFGGAVNPRDADVTVRDEGEHLVFNGGKTFSTGSKVSDVTVLEGVLEGPGVPPDTHVFAIVPSDQPGLTFHDDWDNIGQRLTDSGGVVFDDTPVQRSEVLGEDPLTGRVITPYQTLVTPHWQLAFVNFYIGTAQGALDEALDWTRRHAAPWETSGVDRAVDDAYILQTVGELQSEVRAAALLADRAGDALQAALDHGPTLGAEQRADAAIAIYEAKYLTTKVALDTASRLFEIQGARATSSAYGFDRHWRNLRTHTVHDPVAYKAREVGDWTLNRRAPEFSLYR